MLRERASAVARSAEGDAAPSATDAVEAANAAVAAAEDAAAPPSCTISLDLLSAKRELYVHYFHRTCVMNWMETRERTHVQLQQPRGLARNEGGKPLSDSER
ncbi:hypothetical protein PRIPAC_94264 [Pristionchus pacificus]|uniref:Uncharacterized protein n=1 Tax=Pristionchus pacificus TaxID=54126 RepID=A0A2A6CDV4_PRIPA|nr:hypothetical protein PRIPAC_94264 [Pristionchus pacificus]|eukprot:PDM76384.1 hypothetical protein PRIPAC_39988 [Pristionchus pacificus]